MFLPLEDLEIASALGRGWIVLLLLSFRLDPLSFSPDMILAFCLHACAHGDEDKASHVFQVGHAKIISPCRIKHSSYSHNGLANITWSNTLPANSVETHICVLANSQKLFDKVGAASSQTRANGLLFR